jgi:predicted ATPase
MWTRDEHELFDALDAAQDAHLLSETEDGYVFRHPLLQEVVYERIPTHRRPGLHERAGLTLEALYEGTVGDHAAELARHFVAAGSRYRDQAVRYLTLAGDSAADVYA